MLDSQVLAFVAVVAVLTVTPGADTMLVFRNTLRGGRPFGWSTTAGILSGTLLHALMSAAGLSIILAQSATAFQTVKLLGAAYLIFLGVRTFLSGRDASTSTAVEGSIGKRQVSSREVFLEGFVTNILNPKVAVFYLAFLPQFIAPGDLVLAKSLLLACIHNLMGLVWLGGLAVAISNGARWIEQPAVHRWVTRLSGTVLVCLGIRLALED